MTLRFAFVMLAALLIAGEVTGYAGPADGPADAAYLEGRRLYDLQEWDGAIAKFKEAYTLRQDEKSLFNIAQVYRLKGDCVQAQSFYKTFRRNFSSSPLAPKADKFIADLDACVTAARGQPVKPDAVKTEPVKTEPVKTDPVKTDPVKTEPVKTEPVKTEPVKTEPVKMEAVTPTTATAPEETDNASRPGHAMRLAGLVTMVVGVAALAGGSYFGLKAGSTATDVEKGQGPWDPTLQNRGESESRTATGLFAIGALVAIGGGVLFYLGGRHAESSPVAVLPRGDGATVVWTCGF